MKPCRSHNSGFTLLEIMVALAVAAIGLGAISKSLTSSVDIATKLNHRTLATWVASNRMAELRIDRLFISTGSRTSETEMAGLEWNIKENYAATPDPNIARIDIEVSGTDNNSSVSLTGYLARYRKAIGGS